MNEIRRMIGAAVLAATVLVATAFTAAPAAPAAPGVAPSSPAAQLSAAEVEFVAQARKIAPALTGARPRLPPPEVRGELKLFTLPDAVPTGLDSPAEFRQ